MRMLRIICFFLLMPLLSRAQNVNANLHLEKDEIPIGGQVKAVLSLDFPVTDAIAFPILQDSLIKSIEIVAKDTIDTSYSEDLSRKVLSQELTLTSFDTGYIAIPPIAFSSGTDTVRTEPALLHVIPMKVEVAESATQGEVEIKDIKDIRTVDFSLIEWLKENWWYFLYAAMLIAAIWAFFKYIRPMMQKKGPVVQVRKVVPLHERYLKKLAELENAKLWQTGKVKEYQSSLSEIVRSYIEERYGIPALESTTAEILSSLSHQGFSQNQIEDLTHLLNLADLVKFARHQPMPDEHSRSMEKAQVFVKSTAEKEIESEENKDV